MNIKNLSVSYREKFGIMVLSLYGEKYTTRLRTIPANGAIGYYEEFFKDVKVFETNVWLRLPVDEIVRIFLRAVSELKTSLELCRELKIHEHEDMSWVKKRWIEFKGWKPPGVPSKNEVTKQVIGQCILLSKYFSRQNKEMLKRNELEYFISKPLEVAGHLYLGK